MAQYLESKIKETEDYKVNNLFRIGQEVRIGDNKGVIISKPLEGTKNSVVYKVKEYVGKDVVFRVLFEEEIYMIL